MNKKVIKWFLIIILGFIIISIGNTDFFISGEKANVVEVESNIISKLAKFIEGIILWIIDFIVSFISNIMKFLFGN